MLWLYLQAWLSRSNKSYLHVAGLQPVLVHLSKNAQGTFSFNPVSINFLVEVVKTIFAIIMLILYVSSISHVQSECMLVTPT